MCNWGLRSGNTTITTCRQTRGIVRKSHTAIMRHHVDKQSKATSPFFHIKMIAKLEWNKVTEQLQNPTMGVTINDESTAKEPSPKNRQQLNPLGGGGGGGGLKCNLLLPNIHPRFCCCLSTKNVGLAWRTPNYCNVASLRNNIIK